MNAGLPKIMGGKLVITLFLEQTMSPEPILITHELAHFIIKLQGVKGVVDFKPFSNSAQIQASLNSFAQHRAVYALQRRYNQDPQAMIDRRTKLNTLSLSNSHEPYDKQTQIERALLLCDDLLNCSQENYAIMQDALARHEQTNNLVKSVLSIASSFDLTNLEEITPFCLKSINDLDLGEQWVVIDEVNGWKEEANRLGN